MGLKRFMKKTLFGGGDIIRGHIFDAMERKAKTGRSFRECLGESVKETFTEDLPGTSHVYEMGRADGKVEGTIEQARRDEDKFKAQHREHELDRQKWREIDKEKDRLIDDMAKELENE